MKRLLRTAFHVLLGLFIVASWAGWIDAKQIIERSMTSDQISAGLIAIVLLILFIGHERRKRSEEIGHNQRMRRALGTERVEAQANCRLLDDSEVRAIQSEKDYLEQPRCPECGTRFGLHDWDCSYKLGLDRLTKGGEGK